MLNEKAGIHDLKKMRIVMKEEIQQMFKMLFCNFSEDMKESLEKKLGLKEFQE